MSKRENVAKKTLEACFQMLEGIDDPLLKYVAIAIFAPKGLSVPGPRDHSKALEEIPRDMYHELRMRGKLEDLFAENETAMSLLLMAVNSIHALFRAPELSKEALQEALGIIREG